MKKLVQLILVSVMSLTLSIIHAEDDEAEKALKTARTFTDAGDFAKALERHEWFHNNALRINPAFSGVRLSFALSDWARLADMYPPALASLQATRDSGAKGLEAGKAGPFIFQEVQSINEVLGAVPQTIALFKTLDRKNPDLAEKCFIFIKEILLDQGETDLFTRYAGDLVTFLKLQIVDHDFFTSRMKILNVPGMESLVKDKDDALVTLAIKLADIAAKKGDAATAAQLKKIASKTVSDPRLTK
jgi:hypothetical protein